jgi:hypothetical protein
MTEPQPRPQSIRLVKSDREQIIDLATALIGLGVMYYTINPEPFQQAWNRVRAWGYAWNHRISVAEALTAIRSLPETDEP